MFNKKLEKSFIASMLLVCSLTMVGCQSSIDEEVEQRNAEVINSYKRLGYVDYNYYVENETTGDEFDFELLKNMIKARYESGDITYHADTDLAITGYSLAILESFNPDVTQYQAELVAEDVMKWIEAVEEEKKEANKLTNNEIIKLMEDEVYKRFGVINASLFRLVYYLETEEENFSIGEVTAVQTGKKVLKIKVQKYTGDVFVEELQ